MVELYHVTLTSLDPHLFFSITTDLGNLRMYIDTVATVEVKICERHSCPVYIVFYITVLEKSYKSTR